MAASNTALSSADNTPARVATTNPMDNNIAVSNVSGATSAAGISSGGSGVGLATTDHSLLPDMDVFNLSGGGMSGNSKLKKDEAPPPQQEEPDDNAPLFYRYK